MDRTDRTALMRRVIELARRGVDGGHGGPFGCVVVKDGAIVAEAHNEVLSSNDPTAHAEVLAIRRAGAALQTFDLAGCELYTNGAPCCMCMASMLWARLDRAYYVVGMEASTAIGLGDDHLYEELARPLAERRLLPLVRLPQLEAEALAGYRHWLDKPDRTPF